MLARTYNPNTFNSFPCYVQPKLNGVRCLYAGGNFLSRDEKLFPSFLLEHIQRELKSVPSNLVLDGELYKHGWRLQRINGAVALNRKDGHVDTRQIEYHIFDCIDTLDLMADFPIRIRTLETRLFNSTFVRLVKRIKVLNKNEVPELFEYATAYNYEGIILRLPSFPYEPGVHPCISDPSRLVEYRSKSLWKYKSWLDSEFLCVGQTKGLGKAGIGIGALICATQEGRNFNVGSGFEDAERISFSQNPPIGKYIKVKFIGFSKDGLPLNPTFLCVM